MTTQDVEICDKPQNWKSRPDQLEYGKVYFAQTRRVSPSIRAPI
jgi:hypothetical protein